MTGLHVGVFGAGAIGAYVGGRLAAAGVAVTLVGRPALAVAVAREGLEVADHRGFRAVVPARAITVATDAAALAACDVVLVTVKTTDTAAAGAAIAAAARPDALVVSLQNGVRNAQELAALVAPRPVLPGMVPFNVLKRDDRRYFHSVRGRLALQAAPDHAHARALVEALARAGLPVHTYADLAPVLWGKLLLNLNNPINALSGLPIRAQMAQRGYRRVLAACLREALAVLARAGVTPRVDAPLPPGALPGVLGLPDWLFAIVARPMLAMDPEAVTSMQLDLRRGHPTEIDALNGEIVRLGQAVKLQTPLNARIVEAIKAAEGGPVPSLTAEELQRMLAISG
jgi:2-dehydropantoate 2-reductase